MARFLPLFPLNIVVFPGEKLNLHIFEPRYKQLIQECFAENKTFGMPSFLNNGLNLVGTELKIIAIEKIHDNGEMDIKTKGLGIFRVLEFFKQAPNKFYPAGNIEDLPINYQPDQLLQLQITESLRQFYSILGISKIIMELPEDFKIFDIAHHLGLTTEQEYELLTCADEASRQAYTLNHLQKVLPIMLQTEKLKERVKLNGHFKNIVPPNF